MLFGLLVRLFGAVASEGRAGAILQVLAQTVVLAEHRRTHLQNPLGPLRPVPELLRSLYPIVELFYQRFHGTAGDRQPKASITRVVHACLVVLQVRHRLAYHYPRIAARWLLLGL